MNPRTSRRTVLLTGASGLLLVACSSEVPRPTPPPQKDFGKGRDIRDFGDIAVDGSETLNSALQQAARGGFDVVIPAGVVVSAQKTIVLPPQVTLRGEGTVRATTAMPNLIACGSSSRVHGLQLDGSNVVASALLSVGEGSMAVRLQKIRAQGGVAGVSARTGSGRLEVSDCTFTGVGSGVMARGDVDGLSVLRCTFNEWKDRGVWIVGFEDAAPKNVTIRNCVINEPVATGMVRQPIQINGNDARLIQNVKVENNSVTGSGTSYDDPVRPGAADLISLHRCTNFSVRKNKVTKGGDVGITVARQSKNGVVADNTCDQNDSVGICIGSQNSDHVSNILVQDNILTRNGQNRMRDGKPWALAGILVVNGQNIRLIGNKGQGSPGTQTNGISLLNSQVTMSANSIPSAKQNLNKDGKSSISAR